MRNPTDIAYQVSNYTITDEYGQHFNYINQEVGDVTAGLVLDYGFEGVERYQIAASGIRDPQTGEAAGAFDGAGRPSGLPLTFLLENDLVWSRNSTINDAIIASVEGIAQTAALGDDVQWVTIGTRGLGLGEVIVEAGPNGEIDSVIPEGSNNEEAVTQGYDVSLTCSTGSPAIFQGEQVCTTNTQCICTLDHGCPDEVAAIDPATVDRDSFGEAQCDGPQIITRVGGYRNLPGSYRWVALTDADLTTISDVDSVIMKPGESFKLAFAQDLDKDGVLSRVEFIAGSTDSPLNQEDNLKFGDTYPADGSEIGCEDQSIPYFCGTEADQTIPIPLADSRDTDRD
jgi:hypothetical protein